MKLLRTVIGMLVLVALAGGVWILRYPPRWLQHEEKPESDEENKNKETVIPVRLTKVERATLHRYVDAYGTVDPEPARDKRQPASAAVASPVQGVVAQILCQPGQHVTKGALLIQLDDRVATATENQATAALGSAKASLAKLKSTPRPEQLQVAQLTVDKARTTADFAEKNFERQKKLAPQQVTSEKSLQAAEQDLAAARNDVKIAEEQLALLKTSPTPEELAEASAKVNEAEKALALAKIQRELLTIRSPLDATVTRIVANLSDAVDATKVLVELVALDHLVVDAAVPAEELASLKSGQRVQIIEGPERSETESPTTQPATQPTATTRPAEESAHAAKTHAGKVYYIAPQIDRKSNTALVGIELPADTTLRPGQYVRVRIVVEEHENILVVPNDAVVLDPDGNTAVGIVEGDKIVLQPATVGLREGVLTEVEGPDIDDGDRCAISGTWGWPENMKESKFRVIE